MELHRKVSSLIEFLKQKWALHEVRIVSFSYSRGLAPTPEHLLLKDRSCFSVLSAVSPMKWHGTRTKLAVLCLLGFGWESLPAP